MDTKSFLIVCGITAVLLFSGYSFKGINSDYQSTSYYYFTEDEKTEKDFCPYLQQKNNSVCPYINGSKEKSSSECPYRGSGSNCPYLNNEYKKEVCPYSKKELEEELDKKQNRQTINNRST